MANQPRKHHYVPEFYLAGFTESGTDDGRLHVLDKEQLRQWSSTPKGAAHRRDFYAVDLGPEHDPMFVERTLGSCEGKWSSVLRTVIDQQTLPQDESIADLLAFVAFMAVRVPRIRGQIADFLDKASKAELRATMASSQGREQFRQVIETYTQTLSASERAKFEQHVKDDTDFEELAAFVNSDNYTVNYDQTWHVQTMIQNALRLLPVFGLRRWGLCNTPEDAPALICSDWPVCLTWLEQVCGPYPPGFGVRNTLLTIPLSSRLLLASTFEEIPAKRTLTRPEVAMMNSRTQRSADQIYSPEHDFSWQKEDGTIGDARDLLEALRTRTPLT
jgi:hypothetical protein